MERLSKKAQAEQAAAAHEARVRAALRWSDALPPDRDVAPPDGWNELSTGYDFNVYKRRIDVACSSSVFHAIGRTDKTTTQQPRHLYSTRLRALLALRAALERECAEALAAVDTQIEREEKEAL